MLLLFMSLESMEPKDAALCIVAADPFARMLASELVMMMPYARREQEAKAKTVYRPISIPAAIGLGLQGLLPIGVFLYLTGISWELVLFTPALVMYFLYLLIWSRLRGYTGDCCGAVCLLTELTVYLVAASCIGSL